MIKERSLVVLSLLIIVPIGFYTKFYRGPAFYWVNNFLSGVFYEIFWCLIIFFIIPKTRAWKIAFSVFFITCLLEFMQLWHPGFLETIRASFIGVTIVGRSFSWMDFPFYALGTAIGWFWIHWIKQQS
ncbi:DUF2809 domain-containing protein [candidate division KSB1 bacterium]|nr:DUF2809 domain-containing protein [candidate division KSB1 bacterium]